MGRVTAQEIAQPARYVFTDDRDVMRMRLNLGMTGFGKSTLLKHQLEEIQKIKKRIILVDPARDDHNFKGFGREIHHPRELAAVLGPGNATEFQLRVYDPGKTQEERMRFFSFVCWEALKTGDCFLVVDEIHTYCQSKGGTHMEPEQFDQVATIGRHRKVRFLGTCQRPTQIHNNLLKLCQEVNVFRTEDLDGGLKKKLRGDANQDLALGLERLQFLSCKNGEITLCEVPK